MGDKTPSGEKVLLEGHVKDFEDVIQTGQNIIKTSDYSKIISDLRPVEPGHPSDWFPMVKSPTTRGPIRHLLKDRIKE